MDWGKLNDVTDWNDLDKMISEDRVSPDVKRDWKKVEKDKHGLLMGEVGETKEVVKFAAARPAPAINKANDAPVFDWTDMKQYDDDHDQDWFENEEKRLADLYGGSFIKVKYTEQGRPGYFCEICLSEMNAKKSLETHCEGMKHLKKKAMWEKSQLGDDASERAETEITQNAFKKRKLPVSNNANKEPVIGNKRAGFGFGGNRTAGRLENNFESGDFDGPFKYGNPGANFGGRGSNFGGRGNDFGGPRGGFSGSRGRGNFGGGADNFGGVRDSIFGPVEDMGPNFGGRRDDFSGPRGSLGGPRNGSQGTRDFGGPSGAGGAGDGVPIILPDMEKLHGGTTGMLLKKLASCYMKDNDDADLAITVISALASSLREFYMKHKQPKVAELLMEAELKLNTMKAFKAGQTEGQKIYQAGFQANNEAVDNTKDFGRSSQGFGNNQREFGQSNQERGLDQSNDHGMRQNNDRQRSFEPLRGNSQRGNFGPHPSAMSNRNPNFTQGPQRNSFSSGFSPNRGSGFSPNRGRGFNRFNN